MIFYKKEAPKNLLEGLDRAQEMLDERLKNKQITLDQYKRQCLEFAKKRAKYQKKTK